MLGKCAELLISEESVEEATSIREITKTVTTLRNAIEGIAGEIEAG